MAKVVNGRELIRRKADLQRTIWDLCYSNIYCAKNVSELLGAEGFASHMYFHYGVIL